MLQFEQVASTLEQVERIPSRIAMAELLAKLFLQANGEEIKHLAYFLQGSLGPAYKAKELGLAERLTMAALAEACGYEPKEVEEAFGKTGDLGEVAKKLVERKKQVALFTRELSFLEVFRTFQKIANAQGEGSIKLKRKLLAELVHNSSPLEAKYIIRFALGELRLGAGTSTIIEALALAKLGSRERKDEVERAYNLTSDLGEVAKVLWERGEGGLKSISVEVMRPLRPALAERLPSAKEIFAKLGRCAVEYKFDGFRMQIHKKNEEVKIFSRKLEEITHMFHDVVEEVMQLPVNEIIFEGEALAYSQEEERFYSFQETMHRRRKYGIEEMEKKYPLLVFVFDLLYLEGKSLVEAPYEKRRRLLETIFPKGKLKRSEMWIAESAEDIEQKFQEAIEKKLEGIMAKDLHAPYTAGARKFAWIKLKRSYGKSVDTVDAIVLGYYKGKGARAGLLGGLLVGVWNKDLGKIQTIAKVGSGFTEEEMAEWVERLEKIKRSAKPSIVDAAVSPDVWVEPMYVVEVAFDEITLSPVHTCAKEEGKGLALRFPRYVRLRDDKSIEEATDVKEVERLYKLQHQL